MNYIIDGILLVILLLSCVSGIRKGFVKTLFGLGAAIISLVLSFNFKEKLATIFSENWFYDIIYNKVYLYVENIKDTVNTTGESISQTLNNGVLKYFNIGNVQIMDSESVDKISQSIAKPLTDTVSETIAFIISFFALFIVITLLLKIINSIAKLPVIAQLNGLLGFLAGIIKGLIICFVISALFKLVYPYIGVESLANYEEIVNSTVIYKIIATFNPLNII